MGPGGPGPPPYLETKKRPEGPKKKIYETGSPRYLRKVWIRHFKTTDYADKTNLHSSLQVDVNFLSIPRSIRADYRSYHTFIPRLRTLKSRWSERKPNNNDSGLFEITSLYFNHLNYKCMMHVRDFPQP